jgi:AcrR family transcriptional regulator
MSDTPQLEPPKNDRERIIETFMAILADKPIERIGFGEIATRSGVPLTRCRAEFGTVFAILAAHVKDLDRQVLAGIDADMAEEPPRERLFDVLMRRIELLSPHKAAIRSLIDSARRNPGLALALNPIAVRAQSWMLTAADIDASGPRDPRARARHAVRPGAAHLGRRRRSRPRPHHGGPRPRAGERPALVRLARRRVPVGSGRTPLAAPATRPRCGVGRGGVRRPIRHPEVRASSRQT